jgi:transposase-like protein
MMTKTPEMDNIKAYLKKVEKNQISPQNLPDCARCSLEAHYFKLHGYRERCFLIIVGMTVQPEYAPLVRFRCPACNKTVTYSPDFALPYKHYTRQSILGFAENDLTSETATYQQAVMIEHEVPGYPGGEKTLAPSTIHRWITSVSQLIHTRQNALNLICQESPCTTACRDLAQLTVAACKYKSQARKNCLLGGLRLLVVENFFKVTFNLSIFTNLAISCGFT